MQCHLNHGGWCHLLECNWLIFMVHFGPFEAHFWPQILSNAPTLLFIFRTSSWYLHQELFRKEVHLPLFTIGGEFIRVIRLLSVFSLRGGFPTAFSLFSSLRFISWALFEFHYYTGWPMALVFRALAFHALYVSTSLDYSLRGGVGDVYPPCTLNLVNLA